jgi:hypothetical protein
MGRSHQAALADASLAFHQHHGGWTGQCLGNARDLAGPTSTSVLQAGTSCPYMADSRRANSARNCHCLTVVTAFLVPVPGLLSRPG